MGFINWYNRTLWVNKRRISKRKSELVVIKDLKAEQIAAEPKKDPKSGPSVTNLPTMNEDKEVEATTPSNGVAMTPLSAQTTVSGNDDSEEPFDSMAAAELDDTIFFEEHLTMPNADNGYGPIITWIITLPLTFCLWATLPDVRKAGSEKWYPFTFLGSIIWLGLFSYFMV